MIGWRISRSLLESFRPGHLRRSRFPGSQPSRLIGGLPARPWERPSALRALNLPASSLVTLFHSCNVITATVRNPDPPFKIRAPLGPADSSLGRLSIPHRIGFHTPSKARLIHLLPRRRHRLDYGDVLDCSFLVQPSRAILFRSTGPAHSVSLLRVSASLEPTRGSWLQ